MDPAVHAEFVAAALLDRARHLRCEGEAHRWNEEGGRNLVALEQPEDATESFARAVLTLRKRTRVRLTEAKRDGLVVDIEREQHGNARAVRPRTGLQRAPGADGVHDGADRVHAPAPSRLHGGWSGRRLCEEQRGREKQQKWAHGFWGIRTSKRVPGALSWQRLSLRQWRPWASSVSLVRLPLRAQPPPAACARSPQAPPIARQDAALRRHAGPDR